MRSSYSAILVMFYISLCIPAKKSCWDFEGNYFNSIHLGRIGIFIALSLSINKYDLSLHLLRSLI